MGYSMVEPVILSNEGHRTGFWLDAINRVMKRRLSREGLVLKVNRIFGAANRDVVCGQMRKICKASDDLTPFLMDIVRAFTSCDNVSYISA